MSDRPLPPLRDPVNAAGVFSTAWQMFWAQFLQFLPSFADNEIPTGLINGVNTVFTLAHKPATGSLILVKVPAVGAAWPMIMGRDYALSGLTFTDAVAPTVGQSYRAWYRW